MDMNLDLTAWKIAAVVGMNKRLKRSNRCLGRLGTGQFINY
jgi:hypothetical protein